MIDLSDAELIASQLAAIGQSVRLALLCQLAESPLHVTGLAQRVGVPATNVCQHLKHLRHAGLVESQRHGFRVMYQLSAAARKPTHDGAVATLAVGPYRLQLRPEPA